MEKWFLFALLSMLASWFFTFSSKFSVEKNHNPLLVTFYSSTIAAFCWFILLAYIWDIKWNLMLAILWWLWNWFLYLITSITRIVWLKYLDASIYFPIYKTITPIVLVVVALLFMWETLTTKELIWIILGVFVPLMLLWANKKSNDSLKWYLYIFLSVFTTIWALIITKYAISKWADVTLFSIFALLWSSIFSFLFNIKKTKKAIYWNKYLKRTWIITWILNFLTIYFFNVALSYWNNIWVLYTLQSLYIVIPIILSIIIYKEHFNLKKFIAVILTIASIYFLW